MARERSTPRSSCPHPQKAHFNWFLKVVTPQQHSFGIWTVLTIDMEAWSTKHEQPKAPTWRVS